MHDQDRYSYCLDQAVQASSGGRAEEALAWLEEALKHNPGGAEAHNGRGEILWDAGRFEEALREFGDAAEDQPDFYAAQLNRVELLIEEFQQYEESLDFCDALLAESLDDSTEAEVYYLKAKSLFYLEDLEGALFLLKRALKVNPEVAVYRGFEGQILFELGRFGDARRSLDMAVVLDPEAGHAVYHQALVLERLGHDEDSVRSFHRANALDPEHYPVPATVDGDFFRRAVEEALDNLPRSIREYVGDVPVLVEDFPGGELMSNENVSPQILGIYIGTPRTQAEVAAQPEEVTRIMLFKRNLEKICRDRSDLIEQIQITVRHEIGHHLGLSEEDMERLGLA